MKQMLPKLLTSTNWLLRQLWMDLAGLLASSLLTMTRVFLVGAKRTAFGAFGGKLTKYSATDRAVVATKAALSSSGVSPAAVDTVVVATIPGRPGGNGCGGNDGSGT